MGEYVMVPREVAEAAWQALDDDGRFEESCPLREALEKPARGQGEPVALPARKTVTAGLLSESNTHNQGWNACLDEIDKLGPLYSRPVQGEPVACVKVDFLPEGAIGRLIWFTPSSFEPGQELKLYTHADPGEVERLRALSVTNIMLDITPGEDGMGHEVYAKSVDDFVQKFSSMGERLENLEIWHGGFRELLRKIRPYLLSQEGIAAEIDAALSASAESSAPKCGPGNACAYPASCGCQSAPAERTVMCCGACPAGCVARAALERKP